MNTAPSLTTILLDGLVEPSGYRLAETYEQMCRRAEHLAVVIRLAKAEQRRLIAEAPLFREVRHG
ncbi:MAG: hypothetical protein EPN20_19765 [Magnetospirillum sp.]|nr:MAG: hypothetical protein EPN20_19765 [Magnetospirillum sp.]